MSNVKRSYNTSRRIRKGFKKERLIHFDLMRPLRIIAKAMTDEYKIESLVVASLGSSSAYLRKLGSSFVAASLQLLLDQEINILLYYRTLNRHRFVGREY